MHRVEIHRSMLRLKLLPKHSSEASAKAEADKIPAIRQLQMLQLYHRSFCLDRSLGNKPKLRQPTEAEATAYEENFVVHK